MCSAEVVSSDSSVTASRQDSVKALPHDTTRDDTLGAAKRPTMPDTAATVALDRMTVRAAALRVYHPSSTSLQASDFSGYYKDLPGVLESVAGVVVHRTGGFGEFSEASIRGGSSQEVGVYLDGIPLNTASGGAVDLGKLPLGTIQQMDIYRGPMPLEFVGRSSGGVINLTSDPRKDIIAGNVEFGSFGYRREGALFRKSLGRTQQCLSIDNSYSKNDYPFHFDNRTPLNPGDDVDMRKQNNDFTSTSASYATSLEISGSQTLRSQVSYNRFDQGIFVYNLADQVLYPRYNGETYSGLVRYENTRDDMAAFSAEVTGRWNATSFRDPLNQFYVGGDKMLAEQQPLVGGRVSLNLSPGKIFHANALLAGSYEHWKHTNLNDPVNAAAFARRLSALGGAELDLNVRDLVAVQVRYVQRYEQDSVRLVDEPGYLDNYDSRKSSYYPNADVLFKAHPVEAFGVSASGRYSSRSPTFFEKFGRGGPYWGNPALKPESKLEGDVGLMLKLPLVKADLTYYQGRTWDKIRAVMMSQSVYRPMNYDMVDYLGVESQQSIRLLGWLAVDNSLSLMRSVLARSVAEYFVGNTVPLDPWLKDCLSLTASVGRFQVGHRLTYTSRYYLDTRNQDLNQSKDEPILDAWVRCDFTKMISITYRLENYLDVAVEDLRDSPRPGRMQFVCANFTFN
jgi:outer membrane cobalamin receptor